MPIAPDAEESTLSLPGPDQAIGFTEHIKPLFRASDRQAMQWAFDLGGATPTSRTTPRRSCSGSAPARCPVTGRGRRRGSTCSSVGWVQACPNRLRLRPRERSTENRGGQIDGCRRRDNPSVGGLPV